LVTLDETLANADPRMIGEQDHAKKFPER